MVKVYADDMLVYAPHVDDHGLIDLKVTQGVNKAGTAEIKMPPVHPAYNAFTPYKTLITIYRHDVLLFRGRVLYLADDLYGCRTITCEGERGFLRDTLALVDGGNTVITGTPEYLLQYHMLLHNLQADEYKQFTLGRVTVTDANEYVRFEHEEIKTLGEVVDKLVELCGGYIVFTDGPDGDRVINWYADMERQSGQMIEFGENLLDFSRTGHDELATVVYPYGAKDEETGERVDIRSVTAPNKLNISSIWNEEAAARYGKIAAAVYWDDVTLPENLLKKAQQYLEASSLLVTTLELSAVDLSVLDKDIDTFMVGDWVRVYSAPHGLDASFMLRERSYDLLHPEQDKVVLGKDLTTLTGQDVAGDKSGAAQVQRAASNISRDVETAVGKITPSKVNASGTYMTTDGLLLQWGTISVAQIGSGLATSTEIRFAYEYRDNPAVMLTPMGSTPSLQVSRVDTTGASIEASSAAAGEVTVQWLAIGQSV